MTSNASSSSVSVVMAVYNGATYLKEQLTSVLQELRYGDELIIVDDCSKDHSRALVSSFADADGRVSFVENQINLGVRLTFERGLSMVKNPIVFLCDQDDVWLSGKRDAFVGVFNERPDVMVVLSDAEVIDGEGNVLEPSFMATRGGFEGGVLHTLVRNRYLGCAMAFRQALLDVALPVPRLAPMHDMWFGVIGRSLGQTKYIPTPFIQYRRHGSNVSPGKRQGMAQMVKWRLALSWALIARLAMRHSRSGKGENKK